MSWRNRSLSHRRGWWPLNGHALDKSGYRNHGTLVNTPTWAENQNKRQCIELNGVTQHVNLHDLAYLNAVNKFTISCWMNQNILDVLDIIFEKSSDITINTSAGGDLVIYVTFANNGAFDYSTLIGAGQWYHIAVVFDGTQIGNANRLKLYIDGVPVVLGFTGTIPATTVDLSGVDALIGSTSNSFDGKLSDFRIHDIPLTRDEIIAIMRGNG